MECAIPHLASRRGEGIARHTTNAIPLRLESRIGCPSRHLGEFSGGIFHPLFGDLFVRM
jgi:hypothetical protein